MWHSDNNLAIITQVNIEIIPYLTLKILLISFLVLKSFHSVFDTDLNFWFLFDTTIHFSAFRQLTHMNSNVLILTRAFT
jgi:hypothetical protein